MLDRGVDKGMKLSISVETVSTYDCNCSKKKKVTNRVHGYKQTRDYSWMLFGRTGQKSFPSKTSLPSQHLSRLKKKSLKIFPDKNVSLPKQCPCPTLQKDRAYVSHTTPMYDHANLTLYVFTILGLRGSYLSGVSENNVSDVSLCLLSFSLNTWVILCKKSWSP